MKLRRLTKIRRLPVVHPVTVYAGPFADVVFNTATKRLEFLDGEAVGHRTLSDARRERMPRRARRPA